MTVLFKMALLYVCCFLYFFLKVFIKVYGNLYYCSTSPMKTRKGLNQTEPEVPCRLAFLPSRVSCSWSGTHLSHLCQTCWWEGKDDRQSRSLATEEWWVMSEGRGQAHAAPGFAGTSNSLCYSGKMCPAYPLKGSQFTCRVQATKEYHWCREDLSLSIRSLQLPIRYFQVHPWRLSNHGAVLKWDIVYPSPKCNTSK